MFKKTSTKKDGHTEAQAGKKLPSKMSQTLDTDVLSVPKAPAKDAGTLGIRELDQKTQDDVALKLEFSRLMEKAQWNPSEIAEQLRISQSYVCYLLQGSRVPSETLLELARIKVFLADQVGELFPKELATSPNLRKLKLSKQLGSLFVSILCLDERRQPEAIKHLQGLLNALK